MQSWAANGSPIVQVGLYQIQFPICRQLMSWWNQPCWSRGWLDTFVLQKMGRDFSTKWPCRNSFRWKSWLERLHHTCTRWWKCCGTLCATCRNWQWWQCRRYNQTWAEHQNSSMWSRYQILACTIKRWDRRWFKEWHIGLTNGHAKASFETTLQRNLKKLKPIRTTRLSFLRSNLRLSLEYNKYWMDGP